MVRNHQAVWFTSLIVGNELIVVLALDGGVPQGATPGDHPLVTAPFWLKEEPPGSLQVALLFVSSCIHSLKGEGTGYLLLLRLTLLCPLGKGAIEAVLIYQARLWRTQLQGAPSALTAAG
jgi:hypothetical protein